VAARFNANGSLDSTFSNDGIFSLDASGVDDYIMDVLVQPNGKIVMYGQGFFPDEVILIRLNEDGSYDNSFGTNGVAVMQIGSASEFPGAIALQTDGKIVATGTIAIGSDFDVFVFRVDETGALDNTFGNAGISITHAGDLADWSESVVVADDGKILIAGRSTTSGFDVNGMVIRYTADGMPDLSFGNGGIGIVSALGYWVENIALQADKKIVISGWYYTGNGNDWEFAASRLLSENNVGVENAATSLSDWQLFPNPSSVSTGITFVVLNKSAIRIVLEDLNGRNIKVIVDENLSAGNYTTQIELTDLSKGIYLVKKTERGLTLIQKLVVQ
ncbi:MAG: T9SS type A sorting domain-containing protein, partial [Chitinophagales bacterium]